MNSISKLLSTEGYIQVNKALIKKIGLHEAIIIGELCSEYNYWEKNGKLVDDMFYSTRDNIENNTGLNDHYQRKAIAKLKELGILEVERKDVPAKNYYRIVFDKLLSLLNSRCSRDEHQEVHDMHLNNNKQTNLKKEKTNSKELVQDFSFGKQKPKKQNLFTKCVSLIDDFTRDTQIRIDLTDYLKVLLEMKQDGYNLYTNVWKGLLRKLDQLSTDPNIQHEIIRQSIERGYKSFFPVNNYSKSNDVTKNKPWEEGVRSSRYTEVELEELEELNRQREQAGMRTRF